MSAPLAILGTGLVTSIGLDSSSTCAALRAKVTNSTETRFIDSAGRWINGHQVELPQGHRGTRKLAVMAVMAIVEAIAERQSDIGSELPLLLCTAESSRPGRATDLDAQLFTEIQKLLRTRFSERSEVLALGRVGVAAALSRARAIVHETGKPVLVVAADSLLDAMCLAHYEDARRLLTESNSDGFMPGEGAGALLICAPDDKPRLCCTGLGFATEAASIESGEPLRADGLARAVKQAVQDAGSQMHLIDWRISDLSGEQYYFREASLALSRSMRRLREDFELWHPAESIGETGALAGVSAIALADAACRKSFSRGNAILAHWSNDDGARAAAILHFGAS